VLLPPLLLPLLLCVVPDAAAGLAPRCTQLQLTAMRSPAGIELEFDLVNPDEAVRRGRGAICQSGAEWCSGHTGVASLLTQPTTPLQAPKRQKRRERRGYFMAPVALLALSFHCNSTRQPLQLNPMISLDITGTSPVPAPLASPTVSANCCRSNSTSPPPGRGPLHLSSEH
jgi:hypothetical protein